MSPWIARIGYLAFALSGGCGSAESACPAVTPTVTLGTGDEAFVPLANGDDLALEADSQGGCHLPLSFSMQGLNPRRVDVAYKITAPDNDQLIVDLRQLTRFETASDACLRLGFKAFLVGSAALVGRELLVEIELSDEAGLSAQTQRLLTVQAAPRLPDGQDPCAVR